jgi:hypothetical protein
MSTYGYFKHDEMSDYAIAHHGIKGQKWGVRRFQNPDGSLTAAGRRRYNINWAEKKPGWYYQTGQSIQDQHKMYRDIEKSREFKSYSKQQKNTFLNKMSLDGAEDNPHVHKKGIGASYDTKVSWQKLPINLTFFDSNSNNKNNKKASNFYDKATDKKFLDKLILSSPDGKKDLSKLIDYYRVTYANDNGKDELIVEANIDSNGPAPAEYIFDGKTLKFKETNWV